jgi:4-aminobutyrate aminotransferase-like enzyme
VKPSVSIINPKLSLVDVLGEAYLNSVCEARAFLTGDSRKKFWLIAEEKVDFFPPAFQDRLNQLVECIGERVSEPLIQTIPGAGTAAFTRATRLACAPLSGFGFVRIGEDGKAYLTAKSEHYHASLGHAFPGYRLVENARRLGIPNATHNNTRGFITRKLEQELVRVANGLEKADLEGLRSVLASEEPHILNRVINLETGSLAVEAALKMMLARFYRHEDHERPPKYVGWTPVFLVIADRAGGKKANYHGTTLFTQFMRGLWPELVARLEADRIFLVRQVGINDLAQFQQIVAEYEQEPYKIAGFIHEIVLMNYGGIRLDANFLRQAYAICAKHDIPTMVDEIQSCLWSPQFFLFREYGLMPDFVSIGKGFPGGEYPASRILTTADMDTLSQFGALVTNGQEELASLTYLVTMEFMHANQAYVESLGAYYQSELQRLVAQYPGLIAQIEGHRHLASIFFHQTDLALKFIASLNQSGIDISAQTYKADCPPAALTKIPLISTFPMVDYLISRMRQALAQLS